MLFANSFHSIILINAILPTSPVPTYTASFHFSEYPFGKQGLGMEWGDDDDDDDDDDKIGSEANFWER